MTKIGDLIEQSLFKENQRGDKVLKGFWYGLFMPRSNRYFVGMKLYTAIFLFRYSLPILILTVAMILEPSTSWLPLWVLVISTMFLNFFVIWWLEEKFTWKYLWSGHYEQVQRTDEDKLIKEFEKDPSDENRKKLEEVEKEK